jgi:hypothetical protein
MVTPGASVLSGGGPLRACLLRIEEDGRGAVSVVEPNPVAGHESRLRPDRGDQFLEPLAGFIRVA